MDYQVRFQVMHSVSDLDPRDGRFLDRDEIADSVPPGTYLVFPLPLEVSSRVLATEILDPNGTWEASYRLTLSGTSPVVSEMRIAVGRDYDIPPKGLPSRIAKLARPDRVRRLSHRFFVDAAEQLGPEFVGDQLELAGLDFDALSKPPPSVTGRPRLQDAELAKVAVLYSRHIERASTRPVEDTATQLNLSRAVVADRIRRARQEGFLTEAPGKGIAGGMATPKAHELLKGSEARLSKKETNRTEDGGTK